jgi:hypothetical protein
MTSASDIDPYRVGTVDSLTSEQRILSPRPVSLVPYGRRSVAASRPRALRHSKAGHCRRVNSSPGFGAQRISTRRANPECDERLLQFRKGTPTNPGTVKSFEIRKPLPSHMPESPQTKEIPSTPRMRGTPTRDLARLVSPCFYLPVVSSKEGAKHR